MKELERGAATGIPKGQMLRCLRKDYMQLVSSSLKGEHLIVGAQIAEQVIHSRCSEP